MVFLVQHSAVSMKEMSPPPGPFELQLTAHKGYGLFVTKDTPKGTCILAEEPLIVLPSSENKINLLKQLQKLTPEQHVQYTELASNEGLVSPNLSDSIRLQLAKNAQYSGPALDAAVEDMVKMHAIFFTNAVKLGADGYFGQGLFLDYSRINHSCLPNVQNSYNPTLGQETVYAIRDIEKGEELVSSYITTVRTREQRHQALHHWGFECECAACDGEGSRAHELRRRRLFEIDQAFALYESGNPMARYMTKYPVPTNTKQVLEMAEELAGLLKEEGLVGIDLAHAYRECSKYSIHEGQMAKAMGYAKRELEVEITCLGEKTGHLEHNHERARYWIKHLGNMSESEKVKLRMNEKRHAKEQKKADKKAAKKSGNGRR